MGSILYVSPRDGGVGDHATATIREFERRGIPVRRVTLARRPTAAWRGMAMAVLERRSLRQASVVQVELGLLDAGIFWFVLVASCFRGDIFVLAHDAPAILHSPAAALVPWRGAWADRLAYRVLAPLLDGTLRRLFARRIGQGMVLTENARTAWIDAGARRVTVISHGAYPPSSPAVAPSQGGHVLFAGFVGPVKGLDVLLEVWPEVAAGTDLELVIAGGNTDRGGSVYVDDLRDRSRSLERVRWAGAVDEGTLVALIATAAIVCLPYRSSNPASGIMVRAMSEGRAIVATNVPAVVDALDSRDALIVEPGDAGGLARALIRLAGDPDLRDRLGTAAGLQAARRFSWRNTVDELGEAYAKTSSALLGMRRVGA